MRKTLRGQGVPHFGSIKNCSTAKKRIRPETNNGALEGLRIGDVKRMGFDRSVLFRDRGRDFLQLRPIAAGETDAPTSRCKVNRRRRSESRSAACNEQGSLHVAP
jgi:hypothetical protein